MTKNYNLTGKPSIDKPWMQFYPEEIKMLQIPRCTINEYLKQRCASFDEVVLHYYGNDMTWGVFLEQIETAAKALKVLGFGVGSQIPVFLQSVPEFLVLLLAAEKIGAHIICRDNLPHENAAAVENTGSPVVFAHDFISQENITAMEGVGVQRFVLLSPYQSADREQIPDYIENEIQNLYAGTHDFQVKTMNWNTFMALGEAYAGEYLAPVDVDRPLYSAYTSGSTGTSKQVIHSAYTMLANIHQLSLYGSADGFRPTWLVTILPPCLIAVVNSMLLSAIASRKILIMDPFVNPNDIDLEMMRYQPNGWPAIPMFVEILMKSKRIPKDYDISHLFAVGTGAEALNNGQYRRGLKFLKKHKSDALLTVGYGLTEAGSSCFFPCPAASLEKGAIGMPIPLNTVSIFKPGTQEELTYGEFGEICIHTPAAMLGYDDPEKTAEVLQRHADDLVWIHTGDYGYMDENGVVYIYGRGNTERYGGGYLSEIFMENSVIDAKIPGIVDEFFVIIADDEHPGCYVPYLYVILEDGYTVDDVVAPVMEALQEHERPVEIIQLPERPFFHFKTNRVGLAKELITKRRAQVEAQKAAAAAKLKLTGKPSVDKPWMQFYPEEIKMLQVPKCTINDYLKQRCASLDEVVLHYYGTDVTWSVFLDQIETCAKALKAIGFGIGSQIPVFLQSVPEFLVLLLAAEKIGAHIICRDNLPHENGAAVKSTGSPFVFAHDFISQANITAMEGSGIQRFILLSPYQSADREQIPDYIENEIQSLYAGTHNFQVETMDWNTFMAMGKAYIGEYLAPVDVDRPLYSAYTSGSTGTSKQVIHSAYTMLGNIQQLALYGSADGFRPTWLVTVLPPCLIAVVNSMLLMAIASRKILIMDPFVNPNDIDLEMMRYQPNGWPAIPMFVEILMKSKRIPDDYDISHLFACGTGAEALNNGQYRRALKFLKKHNSEAYLTVGYGLTEAGSSCFFPCPAASLEKGAIGMPIPLNTVSIFKPGTQEELTYGEFGEICINTPAAMLGYDDPEKTAEVLQQHEDGLTWIHTGDYGYMDENGVVYIYGRGNTERYGGGYLSEIFMENSVIDAKIPGIVDEFFVIIEDDKHAGYYIPYLYVILEDGYTVDDISEQVMATLKDYERPVKIIQLPERPFFHFKTNRVGLARELLEKRSAQAEVLEAAEPVVLTGKPSIDKPWLRHYPKSLLNNLQVPSCTLTEYLQHNLPGMDVAAMHYYGNDISWDKVFVDVDRIAKSLKAVGFGVGDQVPVFVSSVPEFITMLLACEKVGASLLIRDNEVHENAEALADSGSKYLFIHDYVTQAEVDTYLATTNVKKIILLDPCYSCNRSDMPDYVQVSLDKNYVGTRASGDAIMSWDDFLILGKNYHGAVDAPADINRPLLCCYTSGSTGPSKQVIHSAHSMIGVLAQMNFYGSADGFRPTWLVTVLPPCLAAVVVSMLILPLASNKLLILDPFVDPMDIDLEMMRYQPNNWPMIPMFMDILVSSKRIPADYDMSHLLAVGAGCEAYNNTQLRRAQKFLNRHNCNVTFTTGYGSSEAGSNITFHVSGAPMGDGNVGCPMPLTTVSIFKPGTTEELGYNMEGELCISGPGIMLGYNDPEATAKALMIHEDGQLWLHMGDIAYMTEEGNIHIAGRGTNKRYGGGFLDLLPMENMVADARIEGILDHFFVNVPDAIHEGYYISYLYVVLEDGYTVENVRAKINAALPLHMIPQQIIQISERPFWHFKTNRIGLTREVLAARGNQKASKMPKLTGKPSVDKPWMQFYPEEIQMLQVPRCTINDYLKQRCGSTDEVVLHYYGTDVTWAVFLDQIETSAKALKALGFGIGSQIPVFFQSVPEFLVLLLAAEKVGAQVVCRDNLPHENADAVKSTGSPVVFAHDFISQDNITAIEGTGIQRFVLLSPYQSADRTQIPDYIEHEIQSLYAGTHNFRVKPMDWNEFLELGRNYTGEYLAPVDVDRPLYSAYTSGSTGTSKQVIHSAYTMLANIHQLALYGSADGFRPTWLVTILPPCLIAVVNSMLLMAIASRKILIMDPFVNVNDIDLEMMRYKPNGWPAIPMFVEILMKSKRIPEDYDISHLFAVGTGAETLNNGQYRRGLQFLKKHKSDAFLTVGYGLTEAGSSCFFPCPAASQEKGAIGMPIPLNTVSIFKPGTQEELTYGEFGEICINTPAAMLGYDDPVKTAEVLQRHADGLDWLHTGDYGYMDENGVLYIYGRGNTKRFGGGYLSEIFMENSVIDAGIPGIIDEFFVIVEDKEHAGYYVPYLYVILEDGYTVEDVTDQILDSLQEFEYPVEIIQLPERPFFHFKTNRIGLAREIKAKYEQ